MKKKQNEKPKIQKYENLSKIVGLYEASFPSAKCLLHRIFSSFCFQIFICFLDIDP